MSEPRASYPTPSPVPPTPPSPRMSEPDTLEAELRQIQERIARHREAREAYVRKNDARLDDMDGRLDDLEAIVKALAAQIGRSPDPTKKGDQGEGLIGLVLETREELREAIGQLGEQLEAWEERRKEEQETARAEAERIAKERQPWADAWKTTRTVLLTMIVMGLAAAVWGLVTRHVKLVSVDPPRPHEATAQSLPDSQRGPHGALGVLVGPIGAPMCARFDLVRPQMPLRDDPLPLLESHRDDHARGKPGQPS